MIKGIKPGLFSILGKPVEERIATEAENELLEIVTYTKYGFDRGVINKCCSIALQIELHGVFQNFKVGLRKDREKQEKLKQPHRNRLRELEAENEESNTRIADFQDNRIPRSKKNIKDAEEQIRDIRSNSERYTGERIDKVSLYLGGTILVFLSAYLFIFYSSASYSAFFKEFTRNDIGIASSIFDPRALENAWKDGVMELGLILMMPFIFFALGYLIHKFTEQNKITSYLKVAVLLVVTFVFDAILAFKISKEIYDLNQTLLSEEFSIAKALETISFWLIIFAGFVVYVVWGFVLDFTIEAYHKMDRVGNLIKQKENEIQSAEKEIKEYQRAIDELNDKVANTTKEINKVQEILNSFIFNPKEYEKIHSEFMSGWIESISVLKKGGAKEAHDISTRFLHNINQEVTLQEISSV